MGLIACNLPCFSSYIACALSKALRRGFDLSWTPIRHAVATISLRSRSDNNSNPGRTNQFNPSPYRPATASLIKSSLYQSGNSVEVQLLNLTPAKVRDEEQGVVEERGFDAV